MRFGQAVSCLDSACLCAGKTVSYQGCHVCLAAHTQPSHLHWYVRQGSYPCKPGVVLGWARGGRVNMEAREQAEYGREQTGVVIEGDAQQCDQHAPLQFW